MLQSLPTDVLLYVIQPFLDYQSRVQLHVALPPRDKCVRRIWRAVMVQHHLHAWKQTCAGMMRRMTDVARPPAERMTHATRLVSLFVHRPDTVRLLVNHVPGFRATLLEIMQYQGLDTVNAPLHVSAMALLTNTHFTSRVHGCAIKF